jgi:RNA polymerase II elongation factor ELL
LDLSISPDTFRNELYTSASSNDLDFDAVITHRATVAPVQTKEPDTAGADAALAALQNSMASYQQEKKAMSATITNDIIPEPKSRWEAAKKGKRGLLGMNSGSSSPSLSAVGTPRAGLSVTSAPSDQNLRRQAMKIPIVHLLAMKPASTEEIIRTTHIPKMDLEAVVSKIAQQVEGKWKLLDRAYKDLNVWDFGYRTQEDRQMAIDNAIRAYDRTRVGKEENTWQLLLPKEERGKGKVISKLHLSVPQTNRGSTPSHMPSPLADGSEDEKPVSSANTPRAGQSGTPKPTVAKSAGSDMMKRLLAKDPKKARAAEEAKEKRKRNREAAASDREGRPAKKQKPVTSTTKTTAASSTAAKASSKIKSAELVHSSSDEDEEGEVKDSPPVAPSKPGKLVAPTTVKPKAAATRSPESGDNHVKPTKPVTKAVLSSKPKTSTPSIKSTASPAVKPTKTTAPGGSTPSNSALSAPQRQRSQLSPNKSHSRPPVPSPLGAARPRNASDVSDRSAVGVQRTKQGGASTPKGLGITSAVNGARKKRQDTVTSHESFNSSEGDKRTAASRAPADKTRAPVPNGVSSQRSLVANSAKPTATNKRKAEEPLSRNHPAPEAKKHHKADSVSTNSNSQRSFATVRTMAITNGATPDAVFDSGSSDSSGSVIDTITYEQGVEKAKKFREQFYPQYVRLHDSISERQKKGETIQKDEREKLWRMHRRLEELKREIGVAAKRGEA